jgi:putative transcriptional regulator
MTFVVMVFTVNAAALCHASLVQLPRTQWPIKSNSLNQRRIDESAMMALPVNRDGAMLRVRLKADGRLVEILPDGSERDIAPDPRSIATAAHNAARAAAAAGRLDDAAYARNVRSRTGLTQTVFAARIGVPVETVRNWEQGKRSPRGPARALLKVIEEAPEAAFAVLAKAR